jgi:hypothetical protein
VKFFVLFTNSFQAPCLLFFRLPTNISQSALLCILFPCSPLNLSSSTFVPSETPHVRVRVNLHICISQQKHACQCWALLGRAMQAQRYNNQQGVLQGDPAGQATKWESRSRARSLHQQAPGAAPPSLLLVPPSPPPPVQQPPSPPTPSPPQCVSGALFCGNCGPCQPLCPGFGLPGPLRCYFVNCCPDLPVGDCSVVRSQITNVGVLGVSCRKELVIA